VLIESYSAYLLERRGLAPSSVRNYVGVARVFLADRERARGELALMELDGAAVSEFVLRESRRCSVGSAKCMVTRLRALLRFLHVEGEIGRDLAGAVPSVASWRLASLVRAIDARSVARLLASCDGRTRVGRRDFAILTLLSRLGLRAGEVAAFELSDIDWRAGEVLIRGKGSRRERLPLPADVGETLVGWLARGRPRCGSVFAFTRLRAPHGGLSAGAVSQIVRRACQRADLPMVGAHRLRHAAATEMLRAGASLTEVGQVLRHRGRDVTRSTPRSTGSRSPRSFSRGRERQRERPRRARPELPAAPPRAGLQARRRGPAAAPVRRVRRRRRAGHRHDQHGAGMGEVAARRQPQLPVAAAASGARLRPLPQGARPGLRGPAARAVGGEQAPPGPVSQGPNPTGPAGSRRSR
jgi:integrase